MSYKDKQLVTLKKENTSATKKKYKINRKISIQSKRKEKYLIADTAYLTQSNIADIIGYCKNHVCIESYFILITLFTGRNIAKLKEVDILSNQSNQSYFIFEYNLKKEEVPEPLQPLYNIPITKIKLPLPHKIFKPYLNIDFTIPCEDSCKTFISKLKKKYSISNEITINKISEYLSFWLINNQHDTSDIAIITKKLSDLSSGIHYYQVNCMHIHQVYLHYMNHLLTISNYKTQKTKPLMEGVLGSTYVLKKKIVAKYFELLSNRIKKLGTNHFIERHNLYVLYTLNILNLSTAHRPVCDPYQLLKHFNLEKNLVYICDKRRDSALPYRFGVLCELARIQFDHYTHYLKKIQNTNKFFIEGLYQTIEDMLNSKIPIFLFIKNGEFLNVNNSLISEFSKDILPIAPNWNRHFMKTSLSSEKVSGQLIDMYMGHDGGGDYGLAKYSSLSEQDLYIVAKIVNKVLANLKIEPLKL